MKFDATPPRLQYEPSRLWQLRSKSSGTESKYYLPRKIGQQSQSTVVTESETAVSQETYDKLREYLGDEFSTKSGSIYPNSALKSTKQTSLAWDIISSTISKATRFAEPLVTISGPCAIDYYRNQCIDSIWKVEHETLSSEEFAKMGNLPSRRVKLIDSSCSYVNSDDEIWDESSIRMERNTAQTHLRADIEQRSMDQLQVMEFCDSVISITNENKDCSDVENEKSFKIRHESGSPTYPDRFTDGDLESSRSSTPRFGSYLEKKLSGASLPPQPLEQRGGSSKEEGIVPALAYDSQMHTDIFPTERLVTGYEVSAFNYEAVGFPSLQISDVPNGLQQTEKFEGEVPRHILDNSDTSTIKIVDIGSVYSSSVQISKSTGGQVSFDLEHLNPYYASSSLGSDTKSQSLSNQHRRAYPNILDDLPGHSKPMAEFLDTSEENSEELSWSFEKSIRLENNSEFVATKPILKRKQNVVFDNRMVHYRKTTLAPISTKMRTHTIPLNDSDELMMTQLQLDGYHQVTVLSDNSEAPLEVDSDSHSVIADFDGFEAESASDITHLAEILPVPSRNKDNNDWSVTDLETKLVYTRDFNVTDDSIQIDKQCRFKLCQFRKFFSSVRSLFNKH